MSRKLKKKSLLLILVEVVCLVIVGSMLILTQSNMSIDNYKEDIQHEMDSLAHIVEEAEKEKEDTISTYDEIYKSRADSVAFMANNETGFELSDTKMLEYKELLHVDNVVIIDKEGNILAKAQDTLADFKKERYNQLKQTMHTGELSEAFEVEIEGKTNRYYGAKINDNQMVVIEQNPKDLNELLEDTVETGSVLKNISVGLEGYVFSLSAKNYLIEYHPDKDLIGADALDAGIGVEDLEDGNFTWLDIDGESVYAGITKINDSYYISAIPESEISSSRNITMGVILFIFFAVMTIVITYGIFVMKEHENDDENSEQYEHYGKFIYNKSVGKKARILSVLGIVLIFAISYYMQTLFSLSRQSMSNMERVEEVERTMKIYADEADLLTEQYNERYLIKAETAAYIMEHNPSLTSKEKLNELADALQIQYVFAFDETGTIEGTNSPFTNFTLSDDPKDQSYEFRKLLLGVENLIQEPQKDEISEEFRQYIGVARQDKEGNNDGFVQIAIRPSRLENILKNMKIENILDGISVGSKGFSFALDKKDHTFIYYPEDKLIGRDALAYGMEERQFKDGYSDYITIQDERYFASSLETDDCYVYIAVPQSELMAERLPMTLMATGIALICMVIIYFLLCFSKKETVIIVQDEEEEEGMIDVTMPDGRVKRTDTASSRWANLSVDWDEKSAEQKIMTIIRWLAALMTAAICISVLFEDSIFGSNSIMSYVLSGKWEKGINVFALTGCILVICIVSAITTLIRKVLAVLADTFSARGETVCRMISSFLKYFSIVAMLYYCFAMFGVDTATLLASAGIISIAISFGAKELVTDILCGLFIIFEGEFRVGDIIMIGDWRGTVLEIGIRTTKVEDGAKNVKIIRNSAVSNVINMTKRFSFAACDVGIEYGESLERVESIFEKEFPNIKEALPAIQDGPFYKGVVALADNSVNLRIVAQCHEGDRVQLERDLMRQMKIIFDKYDINIPFPQVVINEPIEFKKATAYEKYKANLFTNEQREASKEIGNEEEDR